MKLGKMTAPEAKRDGKQSKEAAGGGRRLQNFLAPFLLAGVLSVLAIGLLLQLYLSQSAAGRDGVASGERLAAYAASARSSLARWQERVAGLALAPNLSAALLAKDPAQLAEAEAWLARQLPEAQALRLLPPGINLAEPASKPAISNVTLNLLRQAERGELPAPELLLPGQPGSHLAILAPVREGKLVRGVLLVGFAPEFGKQLLDGLPELHGHLQILQGSGERELVIASLGDAAAQSETVEPARAPLANSLWQLRYWPGEGDPLAGNDDMLVLLGGLALVALLMTGLLFQAQRVLGKELEDDGSRLLKLLLDHYGARFRVPADLFRSRLFFDIGSALARGVVEKTMDAPVVHATGAAAPAAGGDALEIEVKEEVRVPAVDIDHSIFRAYDIRGVVDKNLSPEVVRQIGRAIGSEAYDRGEQKVVVARDGRLSGPYLLEALKQGLMESGRDVIDIGEVPTPVLYFATHYLDARSGVMLTGSHNPPDYNGLKIVLGGETLSGDDIQKLYQRIIKGDLLSGLGSQEKTNIVGDYIGHITADVALAQHLKIVIDCGNGVAGRVAPELYRALGCEVVELYCEVDGNFPNHHPDPSKPENLKELIARVRSEGADIGLAFDGDGDRLGVIASDGTVIWPDRQMMLFAMDLLSRHPGADVIFDVKCTRGLAKVIAGHGGRPLMWKTGHSLIKAKMRETGALLAGERSGHIFIKERWYGFDDGLYAGARMLEIVALDFRKSADIFRILPDSLSTPELNLDIADDRKFAYMDLLAKRGEFPGGEVNTIDGIRVDWPDGWGLVRPSNTTPCLVIRFEADDEDGLKRIQDLFRRQMLNLDASLRLPF